MGVQYEALTNRFQSRTARLKEIEALSGSGVDRILDAIQNQRWFFFKNYTKFLMDRDTGLLWANPDYFPFKDKKSGEDYACEDMKAVIDGFSFDADFQFRVPLPSELVNLFNQKDNDRSFPFATDRNTICGESCWAVWVDHSIKCYWLPKRGDSMYGSLWYKYKTAFCIGALLPCSDGLVKGTDYESSLADQHVLSKEERLKRTLTLFVKNGLQPIFKDEQITSLFYQLYVEKPALVEQVRKDEAELERLRKSALHPVELDEAALLAKYDLPAIDGSVIRYREAVQQWIKDLLDAISAYALQKKDAINACNLLTLRVNRPYVDDKTLSAEENGLLRNRRLYFANVFSLGMNSTQSKLLSMKRQADALEARMEEINCSETSLYELALLEKESRPSFALIAENTVSIVRKALNKIELFDSNRSYVNWAAEELEHWEEQYRVFNTAFLSEFRRDCTEDGIPEEVLQRLCSDWRALRFRIEGKLQPVLERELNAPILKTEDGETTVSQQLVTALQTYRDAVDKFFREERKDIFQNNAFRVNGDLNDRLEAESSLYKLTASFQQALQSIVFRCAAVEDRVFIMTWADDLLDLQIDEVLSLISDPSLDQVSESILSGLSQLKQKNYEIYLADAAAFAEEQARHDKQFHSLMFKMRMGLQKQDAHD